MGNIETIDSIVMQLEKKVDLLQAQVELLTKNNEEILKILGKQKQKKETK